MRLSNPTRAFFESIFIFRAAEIAAEPVSFPDSSSTGACLRIKDIQSASNDEILQNLLNTLTNLKNGHLTTRMTEGFPGLYADIARTLNAHLEMLTTLSSEHARLMKEIGVSLGGQMEVPGASGSWKQITDDVNRANLTAQFRDGANIVRDILHGHPDARVTCNQIQGEFAEFKTNLNKLADIHEHAIGSCRYNSKE